MRIVHIITRLIIGGAQENTVLCCEDLIRDYGDEVLLVTGPPLGPEGSLLERARAGGVPLEIIPQLRRPIQPWRDLLSYRRIKSVLGRFRPDVVHTHSAKGGMLGRAAAWSLGVPAVIHTVHGAPFHPYQGRAVALVFRACERWAARRCHAMVSVADAMTELMVAGGVAPRENSPPFTAAWRSSRFCSRAQRARAGAAGARLPGGERGHRQNRPAVSPQGPRRRDSGGPRRRRRPAQRPFLCLSAMACSAARLERQIAAAGLGDYFQFTGLVPPQRIPGLIAASDMIVHASLREGLARVLPQALIAGKPVVSYDVDGAREVVLPDETGFLVPPRDVEALGRGAEKSGRRPGLAGSVGPRGSSAIHRRLPA